MLFLLVEPVQPLDLFGPLEVLRGANAILWRRGPRYVIDVVGWSGAEVKSDAGIALVTQGTAPTVAPRLDTLVVVGGHGPLEVEDERLSRWLRQAAAHARRTVSVCTGSFLLARAGILDGRAATTHWQYSATLARAFPHVRVDPSRTWVQDGAVYTSAGVTTGIDLALSLVAADEGQEVALKVARALVVFLLRAGGEAQLSAALAAQRSAVDPVRELVVWIEHNLRRGPRGRGAREAGGHEPAQLLPRLHARHREPSCPVRDPAADRGGPAGARERPQQPGGDLRARRLRQRRRDVASVRADRRDHARGLP